MQLYGSNSTQELEPQDLARCMIDTYRGMNKHFIPTGYELSSFARVFDQSRKGRITAEDVMATATRMFLANKKETSTFRWSQNPILNIFFLHCLFLEKIFGLIKITRFRFDNYTRSKNIKSYRKNRRKNMEFCNRDSRRHLDTKCCLHIQMLSFKFRIKLRYQDYYY